MLYRPLTATPLTTKLAVVLGVACLFYVMFYMTFHDDILFIGSCVAVGIVLLNGWE